MELYRTRLPISHFIILAAATSFAAMLVYFSMSIIGTIFYSIILLLILMMAWNRNGTVVLNDKALEIKYVFPYRKRVYVEVTSIKNIKIKFGEIVFYKLWLSTIEAKERREDKLIIATEEGLYTYRINTNRADLLQLVKMTNCIPI